MRLFLKSSAPNPVSPSLRTFFPHHWPPWVNLTIKLSDEDVQILQAKATARGVSAEQYALEVLEHDLAAKDRYPAHRRFDDLSDLLLGSPFLAPTPTWSTPKTTRAPLILDEWFPDRYQCSVRI